MNRVEALRQLRILKDAIAENPSKTVIQISDETFQVYKGGYLVATHYIDTSKTTSQEGWQESWMLKQR